MAAAERGESQEFDDVFDRLEAWHGPAERPSDGERAGESRTPTR